MKVNETITIGWRIFRRISKAQINRYPEHHLFLMNKGGQVRMTTAAEARNSTSTILVSEGFVTEVKT